MHIHFNYFLINLYLSEFYRICKDTHKLAITKYSMEFGYFVISQMLDS